jgi:hypothetical protein
MNSNGQLVAAGVYTVEFTETTGATPVSFVAQATVLTVESQSSLSIFNSAGEVVDYFPLVPGAAAYLDLSSDSFVPGPGKGVTISWGPGADSMQWDGVNSAGEQVASGVYTVQITSQSPGSALVTLKGLVQVVDASTDLLGGALLAPNPIAGSGQTLHIYAPNLQASDSLEVGLYDLAGQLVAKAYGEGSGMQMTLPNEAAGGIYLVVLQARSAETGASQRKVLKLAVLRKNAQF